MFHFTRTLVLDSRQIDYTAFPDDIHFEIRSRCTISARIFLAMTCKREYDSFLILRPYILHALARDKENYLVEVGLKYFTDQDRQDIHDINHHALVAMNIDLYHFLANHPFMTTNRPCGTCLQYTVRTGNNEEIVKSMELYTKHCMVDNRSDGYARVLVTGEAIRIANVPLVQWLLDTKMFASETWFDGKISPRIDPLNWFEMMGVVKSHVNIEGFLWLKDRLFDLINIQRKWSFEHIVSFLEKHERMLDEIEDFDDALLDVRMGVLWKDFFSSAIECQNTSIYKQVWERIVDSGRVALELAWIHLARVDDNKCSIGTLLFPSMDSLNKSRMPGEFAICRVYCNRLQGVLQSLQK
jgi:hypothetical protein